jgi:hypothetical protein
VKSASLIAAALLVLAGLGCSSRSPITPDVGGPQQTSDPGIATAHRPGAATTFQSEPQWYTVASKTVKPLMGGTVSGSRYSVLVPPLALSKSTAISIREYSPDVLDFELLPHGTQFLTPVTVTVDYQGTSLDPASPNYDGGLPLLLWLNPSTGLWELVPGVDNPLTKTYTVLLSHFSRYAVSSQPGTAEW